MESLREELEQLKLRLLDMAAQVERNIGMAVDGLRDRNPEALHQVIQRDFDIDMLELQIDEDCISLIALRQPVARDLRFVATALKIVKDMERVGDIAKSIAKLGLLLLSERPLPLPPGMTRMAQASQGLLRNALDAFVALDPDLARSVITEDDLVDSLHRENVELILAQILREPGLVGPLTQLMSINKFLERIGDHSTNIAAMVVYLEEGRDIRHPKRRRGIPEDWPPEDS